MTIVNHVLKRRGERVVVCHGEDGTCGEKLDTKTPKVWRDEQLRLPIDISVTTFSQVLERDCEKIIGILKMSIEFFNYEHRFIRPVFGHSSTFIQKKDRAQGGDLSDTREIVHSRVKA